MSLSEKALATRERILHAADELFYLYGYNATGLDKIIKQAEVTKGNFYYHFKSKEALAVASLERHFELTAKELDEMILSKNKSPLTTLYALLDFMSDRQKNQHKDGYIRGCYFGNFTLELSTASNPVSHKVSHIFNQYMHIMESLLRQARDAGEIPEHVDPVAISSIILSQMEGAILLDKANQQPSAVDASIKFIKSFLSS